MVNSQLLKLYRVDMKQEWCICQTDTYFAAYLLDKPQRNEFLLVLLSIYAKFLAGITLFANATLNCHARTAKCANYTVNIMVKSPFKSQSSVVEQVRTNRRRDEATAETDRQWLKAADCSLQ